MDLTSKKRERIKIAETQQARLTLLTNLMEEMLSYYNLIALQLHLAHL